MLEGKIQINRFGYRLHGQPRRELGTRNVSSGRAGVAEIPLVSLRLSSRKYISCVEMDPRISAYCQRGMERRIARGYRMRELHNYARRIKELVERTVCIYARIEWEDT